MSDYTIHDYLDDMRDFDPAGDDEYPRDTEFLNGFPVQEPEPYAYAEFNFRSGTDLSGGINA